MAEVDFRWREPGKPAVRYLGTILKSFVDKKTTDTFSDFAHERVQTAKDINNNLFLQLSQLSESIWNPDICLDEGKGQRKKKLTQAMKDHLDQKNAESDDKENRTLTPKNKNDPPVPTTKEGEPMTKKQKETVTANTQGDENNANKENCAPSPKKKNKPSGSKTNEEGPAKKRQKKTVSANTQKKNAIAATEAALNDAIVLPSGFLALTNTFLQTKENTHQSQAATPSVETSDKEREAAQISIQRTPAAVQTSTEETGPARAFNSPKTSVPESPPVRQAFDLYMSQKIKGKETNEAPSYEAEVLTKKPLFDYPKGKLPDGYSSWKELLMDNSDASVEKEKKQYTELKVFKNSEIQQEVEQLRKENAVLQMKIEELDNKNKELTEKLNASMENNSKPQALYAPPSVIEWMRQFTEGSCYLAQEQTASPVNGGPTMQYTVRANLQPMKNGKPMTRLLDDRDYYVLREPLIDALNKCSIMPDKKKAAPELLRVVIRLMFCTEELAKSSGQGLRPNGRGSKANEFPPLDEERCRACKDYVKAFCSENDIAEISAKDINVAFTSQVGYARRQQGMTCKKTPDKARIKAKGGTDS